MSRVEECDKTINEVNEFIKTLTDRCEEPGFSIEPGKYLIVGYETAIVSMLTDIAQSLAVIADKCDE